MIKFKNVKITAYTKPPRIGKFKKNVSFKLENETLRIKTEYIKLDNQV